MPKIELQNLRIDIRYDSLKKTSGKEFPKIKKFIDSLKNGESSRGIDIKEATERKYIDAFTMAYKSLKKPLLSITKEDLIKVKDDLKKGIIKSRIKQPYSLTSQRGMELILINFLEFYNPLKYSSFKKWFVVKVPRKDVEYLTEAEIKKLYNNCKSNEERFLVAVLFDSGARASEFLNIRYEDITAPSSTFPYYKINFKEEYSKTKGRNIGLYWDKSTEAIKEYLDEIGELKSKDPVYTKNYDAIRIFLTRFGKRVLGKRLHFHLFRKASASYYAVKLKSRQQLCYRYGWNFSSDVPDVYISRNQGEEEVKTEMVNTTIQKINSENQELKTKLVLTEEHMEDLEIKMRKVLSAFSVVLDSSSKGNLLTEKQFIKKYGKDAYENRRKLKGKHFEELVNEHYKEIVELNPIPKRKSN
jgi:integrase